jgi:hypothetical protein
MGFFIPTPRKEISKRELEGTAFHPSLYSKLKSGDRSVRLNEKELKRLEGIISGHIDSEKDSYGHWRKGIDAQETERIIEQVKSDSDFGEKKAAHIEEHLRKYLEKRM